MSAARALTIDDFAAHARIERKGFPDAFGLSMTACERAMRSGDLPVAYERGRPFTTPPDVDLHLHRDASAVALLRPTVASTIGVFLRLEDLDEIIAVAHALEAVANAAVRVAVGELAVMPRPSLRFGAPRESGPTLKNTAAIAAFLRVSRRQAHRMIAKLDVDRGARGARCTSVDRALASRMRMHEADPDGLLVALTPHGRDVVHGDPRAVLERASDAVRYALL